MRLLSDVVVCVFRGGAVRESPSSRSRSARADFRYGKLVIVARGAKLLAARLLALCSLTHREDEDWQGVVLSPPRSIDRLPPRGRFSALGAALPPARLPARANSARAACRSDRVIEDSRVYKVVRGGSPSFQTLRSVSSVAPGRWTTARAG